MNTNTGIEKQMPELILDMMADLRTSACSSIREFFILRNRDHKPGPSVRFAYYEDEHDDLLGKLDLLIKFGYIIPVASLGTPIYQMTDEFADHLLDGWPERRWPDWWLA